MNFLIQPKLRAVFMPIPQNFKLTQMVQLAKTHSHQLSKQTMK